MARKKPTNSTKPVTQRRRQPSRAAKIKSKAKSTENEMPINVAEVSQIFLDETTAIYDGFLPGYSVEGVLENYDRSTASREIHSTVEVLARDSWLDKELVYFGLRKLVQENIHAQHRVSVIPTITPLLLKSQIETFINEKIRKNRDRYDSIIILRDIGCEKDDPIHAENARRSDLIKQKRDEILLANGLNENGRIKIFLQCMTEELSIDFAEDQQIVIPMRIDMSHFTVAVVQVVDQKATISYKDSFNSECPDSIRQPIVDFFKQQLGADNVCFNNSKVTSKQRQRNGYDCGVFAILNGLDMVRQNARLPKFLPDSITQEYLSMYRGFLFCLYEGLGLKIKLEPGFHKLLNQKMNHIFDHSQKLFQNDKQKKQATDQTGLLIDLIHNSKNGLVKNSGLVSEGKNRLEVLNNNGSGLDVILRELRSLGKELIKISEKDLTVNQKEFVQEQVQETNKILTKMNKTDKMDKTGWLDNPVIQAVKKAAIVTAGVVLVGLMIANLPMIQALEGLLASSSSLFIPVAAAMFSACFLLAVKMPGWLSSDTENNSSIVETGIPPDLNTTGSALLSQPSKVLTPGFEQSKQPQTEELKEVSDKVEEDLQNKTKQNKTKPKK